MTGQRTNDAMTHGHAVNADPVGEQTASYLERNIKDLLVEFPTLGNVLSAAGIGCVTCAVGTCQLRDIVQFHALPAPQLQALLSSIARIVDPDGADAPPPSEVVAAPVAPRTFTYSPPLQRLVQEHAVIKRWLALIPAVLAHIDLTTEADRALAHTGIDFIRSYADRFHHAKEEEILFTHFDGNQEIIQVMLADHATGRHHVAAMIEAVDSRDQAQLATHLLAYRALLSAHITKEDEILYPWMDRQLSITQIGALFQAFDQADRACDPGMAARFEQYIAKLEQSLFNERSF